MVQSRHGADLTGAFPAIAAAASGLGEPLVLDRELAVHHKGRLDFSELQRRARRRGPGAAQAAVERSAHLVVFDVLEARGEELLDHPYSERRAILEDLFARHTFTALFTLCPATRDLVAAQE